MTNITKPTLKWVGGKTKLKYLISDALYLLQSKNNQTFDYYEPFFGGGSIFFHLKDLELIDSAYLNDAIPQLVSYYEIISDRNNLETFIEQCEEIEIKFNKLLSKKERPVSEYKALVSEFNSIWVKEIIVSETEESKKQKKYIQINPKIKEQKIRSAVLMQAINKLCFNGMFRVNGNNQFNVPIGSYKKVNIIDKDNLANASLYLSNAKITCNSYKEIIKNIKKKNSFIYLDPPYIPNSKTSYFTDYSSQGFKNKDHVELGKIYFKLVNAGNNVILSNNNNKLAREIFLQNKKLHCYEVLVSKSINSKKDGRGKIGELLVSTFELKNIEEKFNLKKIK
tara:strand:- start:406 stop:1419 length:1014 start_codon:yes stop_codon:yes gene_type:complete